jgi:hypothetical protein
MIVLLALSPSVQIKDVSIQEVGQQIWSQSKNAGLFWFSDEQSSRIAPVVTQAIDTDPFLDQLFLR